MSSAPINNRVSVIMPAYNIACYIEDSVFSVLKQSFSNLELIIVDDASSDETGEIADVLAHSDARIHVIHSKENVGGAGARNLGLKAAQSRYVAFIDGDDLWHPEKLERQMCLMSRGGVQLAYTAIQKVGPDGRFFGNVQTVTESVDYVTLLGNPLIGCSTVLIDYEAVGRLLMPDIRKRQDFAFWLQLLRAGAVAHGINEPLTYYRVRRGSLSSNKLSAACYTWQVYREFEKLSFWRALPYFFSYAFRAVLKRLNQ